LTSSLLTAALVMSPHAHASTCDVVGGLLLGTHTLDTASDAQITPVGASDELGEASVVADFDGDGLLDLAVAAPAEHNGTHAQAGAIYVFFDAATAMSGSLSASTADLTLTGESRNDRSGHRLAAGDVDGDGLADLVVGSNSSFYAPNLEGVVHVVGGAALTANTGTHPIATVADATILGRANDSKFGRAVAVADMTGDGLDEVLIGAFLADDTGAAQGEVYVFQTPSGALNAVTDASLRIRGDVGSRFGWSIANVGDLDGDGCEDVAIGAKTGVSNDGAAYLWRSECLAGAAVRDASEAHASFTGPVNDELGFSVAAAGDLNGDGVSEVWVGAYKYANNNGAAYLVDGTATGPSPIEDVYLTRISGALTQEYAGSDVIGDVDINGDGLTDVVIGAEYGKNAAGTKVGKASVFYGPIATGSLTTADADAEITGFAASDFASRGLFAADVDADGYDDLFIGAPKRDLTASNGGGVSYIRGGNSGEQWFYEDLDGDGYGDPNVSTFACDAPPNYVAAIGPAPDASTTFGGLPMSVEIVSHEDGEGILGNAATVEAIGTLGMPDAIDAGSMVLVMDISGSAMADADQDPNVDTCGDLNGDGVVDTNLDCQILAAQNMLDTAIANDAIERVAIVAVHGIVGTADVSPAPGQQVWAAPDADDNGNGTLDLIEVLASMRASDTTTFAEVNSFSFLNVAQFPYGSSLYAGVQRACDELANDGAPVKRILMLSDGKNQAIGDVSTWAPCTASPNATLTALSVGFGNAATCEDDFYNEDLNALTARFGGECIKLEDPAEIPEILPQFFAPVVTEVRAYIDGMGPIVLDDDRRRRHRHHDGHADLPGDGRRDARRLQDRGRLRGAARERPARRLAAGRADRGGGQHRHAHGGRCHRPERRPAVLPLDRRRDRRPHDLGRRPAAARDLVRGAGRRRVRHHRRGQRRLAHDDADVADHRDERGADDDVGRARARRWARVHHGRPRGPGTGRHPRGAGGLGRRQRRDLPGDGARAEPRRVHREPSVRRRDAVHHRRHRQRRRRGCGQRLGGRGGP
jgi:hypothetical protein